MDNFLTFPKTIFSNNFFGLKFMCNKDFFSVGDSQFAITKVWLDERISIIFGTTEGA